jgi:glutathione S-transferase
MAGLRPSLGRRPAVCNAMITLHHHPFCPHSRFIRLALGEYGTAFQLMEERVWERRHEFLLLNPAGATPVIADGSGPPVPGAAAIAEYLDETLGALLEEHRLLPEDMAGRIEVRRLTAWFNEKFFSEVSEHLVTEKIYRRQMSKEQGGGSPDAGALRAARSNVRYHLAYIGWLVGRRHWLAGDRLSYADLAAAAHLSVADYLGDVPWNENEAAKTWYARVKSRPGFRPLLAETLPGVPAAASYADLDF